MVFQNYFPEYFKDYQRCYEKRNSQGMPCICMLQPESKNYGNNVLSLNERQRILI